MPTISPPPYQDVAGSLRWQAWYRQINDLLEGISLSIAEIDDITLTTPTDKEILVYASAKFINQTIAEWEDPDFEFDISDVDDLDDVEIPAEFTEITPPGR